MITDFELDALLHSADPLDGDALGGGDLDVPLSGLKAAVIAPAVPRRRSVRRRRPIRFVALAATCGAAAAAWITLGGVSGGAGPASGLPLAVTPAQAAELNQLAMVAAQQRGPNRGQWLYERFDIFEGGSVGWDGHNVNYRDTRSVQQWTGANGASRQRSVYTDFVFATPRDHAVYERYRSQLADGLTFDGPLHPGHVTDTADPSVGAGAGVPQNMPYTTKGIVARFQHLFQREARTVPARDRAQFARQAGVSLFGEIALILAESTSPDQRAAALRAVAYVPGVRMLGTSRDATGRRGLTIEFVWPHGAGQRITLIVDQHTGDLLENTTSDLRPFQGLPVSASLNRTVYFQRAIVSSMKALPGGGTQPYHGLIPRIARSR